MIYRYANRTPITYPSRRRSLARRYSTVVSPWRHHRVRPAPAEGVMLVAGRRRELPLDVAAPVARARMVELAAMTTDQRLRASRASGRLMLAYVQAGWRVAEVA